MSQERRMAVLSAIVEDYVQTSEPVGSKALLDRHQLNVSAATVRNDMAALEDEGLIIAPHTSAGRIPTDAGYRLFVDRLQAIRPMSRGERAAITDYLEGADELDVVLERTVRLLSTLTRQVAVVQYPSLTRSTAKHIELVPMSETRLMVVVIMGTGRVEQRRGVAGHRVEPVVAPSLGAGAGGVAAQVGCEGSQALGVQQWCDMTPGGGGLGEAVQQHYRLAVLRAAFGNL